MYHAKHVIVLASLAVLSHGRPATLRSTGLAKKPGALNAVDLLANVRSQQGRVGAEAVLKPMARLGLLLSAFHLEGASKFKTAAAGEHTPMNIHSARSLPSSTRHMRIVTRAEKRRKANYRRPSAAIERGGQFFVPGVRETDLRRGATAVLIFGLILNRVRSPGEPLFSQYVGESLGAVGCFLLLAQSLVQDRVDRELQEAESRAASVAQLEEQQNLDDSLPHNVADRVRWMVAALLELTPARAVVWVSADGSVLARCGRFPDQANDEDFNVVDIKPLRALFPSGDVGTYAFAKFTDAQSKPPSPLPRNAKSALLLQCGDSGGVLAIASEQPAAFTEKHVQWLQQCAKLLIPNMPKMSSKVTKTDRGTSAQLKSSSQSAEVSLGESLLLSPEALIGTGSTLLLLLVFNRLFTTDLLNSQSRADLIAALAPSFLIFKAFTDLDITPRAADLVQPLGVQTSWINPVVPAHAVPELKWAVDSLFGIPRGASSAFAVALWRDEQTLLLHGTVSPAAASSPTSAITPGPILARAAARLNGAPLYLPALQLLPGRVEFTYLPENMQGVLMLPLLGTVRGVLILGCNRQRGFGPDEVEWARAVAGRLAASLDRNRSDPASITER